MNYIKHIFLLYFLCLSAIYASESSQTHEEILLTVQKYLDTQLTKTSGVEIKTQIGNLDKRLKLSSCNQVLKAFTNNGIKFGSKVSIGVKCEGVKPWSLYVPVKIQRFATVFIASQPIAKGNTIQSTDIQQISQDVTKLRTSYYKTKQDIVGKIAKRSIPLGSVFNPRYLRLPIIVKRGDVVDIIAESAGLQIRMTGKAISDGAIGQTINIKNLSSKRIIQAVVQHPGVVKIAL